MCVLLQVRVARFSRLKRQEQKARLRLGHLSWQMVIRGGMSHGTMVIRAGQWTLYNLYQS